MTMMLFRIMTRAKVGGMMLLMMCVVLSASASSSATAVSIVSQHQSISNVVRDLQKYQQEQNTSDQVVLSCFITSRSVTAKQRKLVIDDILQIGPANVDGTDRPTIQRAIATSDGMVFLQPSTVAEAVQLVSSSSSSVASNENSGTQYMIHRVLYYPDPIDLQRGEGLTDTFGPVLESLLQRPTSSSSSTTPPLIQVLIPNGMESSVVQTKIEAAILELLPYWTIHQHDKNHVDSTHWRDWIRSNIIYTVPQSVMETPLPNSVNPSSSSDVLARLRASSSSSSPRHASHHLVEQPQQWTASNRLRPVAQQQYQNIVSALQLTCFNNADTTTVTTTNNTKKKTDAMKFVPNFGELCDAIVTKEMALWYGDNSSNDAIDLASRKSIVGRQICEKLYDDIFMYVVSNIYTEQISKVQKICFDAFKRDLSKLVVSPNLPTDMNRIGQASISTLVTDTVRLIPKTSFVSHQHVSYLTSYAASVQRMYVRKVLDYIQNRILMAQASGKFRPVPRKGITIGMHYLLPKPFGNDYRQEPSMIHATDQMVYVPPRAKLSDVSTEQISSGDWKNSIVPHPPGNDMLYMQ